MLQYIPLAVAFIGSSVAAAWDLKTTEIPDKIPYIMMVIGLIYFGVQSYLEWNYWPVLLSATSGLSLLGLGFLLYYFGQWGGGDAKILSAVGFLLPTNQQGFAQTVLPFPASYLINVFLVGAVYMLIYATIMAVMNRKIIFAFFKDIKANSKILLFGSIGLFALFSGINLYLTQYLQLGFTPYFFVTNSLLPLAVVIGLYIVWRFAKSVEDVGFKTKIPVSKLKVGDVLLENKLWEGITEKQLRDIKKSGKKIVSIKSGVRFAPSFVLALIFTLYFGDGILFFINLI